MIDPKTMDLRDWFAGQALVGLLAAIKVGPPLNPDMTLKQMEPYTKRAYEFAEAMLKERDRKHA